MCGCGGCDGVVVCVGGWGCGVDDAGGGDGVEWVGGWCSGDVGADGGGGVVVGVGAGEFGVAGGVWDGDGGAGVVGVDGVVVEQSVGVCVSVASV